MKTIQSLFSRFSYGTIVLAQMALVPATAFAIQITDNNIALEKFANKTSPVTIAGDLTCRMGEANNGQPCDLKLKDSKSGKVYGLRGANEIRRLYNNGTRTITVEATFEDDTTLQVGKITASR